jgi:lipoprotein-releasing system ATP-binding protein
MTTPLVVARGLMKAYSTAAGHVPVLQGVDLDVAAGERVAIIGASGVGKSTLLHVLGTLDRADAGALSIAGEDVLALAEERRAEFRSRTLGFVFQLHHLLPEFTALENVAMPLLIARRPLPEAERRARQLLEEVGLASRTLHRPGTLSGGEQQRVAVARALATEPDVVLADEPSGNLDPANADLLHRLLADVVRNGRRALVVVTHNRSLAGLADRILALHDGRLTPSRGDEAMAS